MTNADKERENALRQDSVTAFLDSTAAREAKSGGFPAQFAVCGLLSRVAIPIRPAAVRATVCSAAAVFLTSLCVAVCLGAAACVKSQPATDTGDPGFPLGPTGAAAQPVAYTDLQSMFASDCLECHGFRDVRGNYSMATYDAVLSAVRVGDASCSLVVDTQPGGSMYQYFTGNRELKAAMVFRWVVVYHAQQTR